MAGTVAQTLTSQNGVFHNFTLDNLNGVTLEGGDLEVRRQLRLQNGVFFIQNHKVRVASSTGSLIVLSPGSTKCISTDGSPSAGGLEIINTSPTQTLTFPVAVEDGLGGAKYAPAVVRVNSDWVDEGFIRVVPVDEILPTVDATGGTDRLDFYWRVSHSEYENIPRVSHQFTYDSSDILGDENEFASGRVLSDLPFTRSVDSLAFGEDHVTTSNNRIFYNGSEAASLSLGPGTPLVNADYSAGNWERFDGAPEIFYSRSTTVGASWSDPSNWTSASVCVGCSTPDQYHSSSSPVSSVFPGPGTIAVIGFDPSSPQFKPHLYDAPGVGAQAIQVIFTPMQNTAGVRQPRYNGPASEIGLRRPSLRFASTAQIEDIGQITGEGALIMTGAADITAVDIGDFLSEDSSMVVLQPSATLTLTSFPPNVPNLFVTSGSNGSANVTSTIQSNIVVRGNLEIAGNANLEIWNGAQGDIQVFNNLKLGPYSAATSGAELRFLSTGSLRRVEVFGDVSIRGSNSTIQISGSNNTFPTLIHEFVAWKDIIQDAPSSTGLNFYPLANGDYVSLTLRGFGNHEFLNSAGNPPRLGRLTLDKGTSIASSFNFNGDVDINGPANLPNKPVELRNGLLTFDHPNIDITLSSGGGNFVIPGSAGLVLGDGNLDIFSDETGLILDGLLRIDGGTFSIGDTEGENSFIEYSPSGNARIEVNGGTLAVGSQLRRGLTNTAGILEYVQTGGDVIVGRYDAPSSNRAVFEIVNTGSSFEHTGGTLRIARGINDATTASLLLDPDISNVSGTSQIIIGPTNSAPIPPASSLRNFGIQTAISLNNLTIDNSAGLNPEVRLQVEDLSLDGLLDIDAGAELDCRNRNLILRNDLINNGDLISSAGEVLLDHAGAIPFSVSGSGNYTLFDVRRVGGGSTNINSDLLIGNDYTQDVGIVDLGSNKITLQGNAQIDGSLLCDPSSEGLVFDGNGTQVLRRSGLGSSDINTITLRNGSGVEMIAGAGYIFNIEHWVRMERGVFDLLGNVLVLNENARFDALNAFGENNMINAGGAFTNFGVRVFLPNNSTEERVIPLGINRYMPIIMRFSDEFGNTAGYSSGNNPGNAPSSYLFTLTQGTNSIVQEDTEPSPPQIPDVANALSMFFTVDADNIGTGLRMDMDFQYDDDYVNVSAGQNEADYIAARIYVDALSNDVIQKFPDPASVDETFNLIRFSYDAGNGSGDEEDIDGDYFAGVDGAIPDIVPVYSTSQNMDVDNGNLYTPGPSTAPLLAGETPRGARVNVLAGHTLIVDNSQNIDFFRTDIASGGVLQIDGVGIHRLGRVTGEGTIRLIDTGQLPSGNYNEFFVCNSGFGGKLEFVGSTSTQNFEVLANLSLVERVDFSGLGTMRISNNDVQICTDLTIDGPMVIANSNAQLTVDGDLSILGTGALDQAQGELLVSGNTLIADDGDLLAGNSGTSIFEGNVEFTGTSLSQFDLGSFNRETILRSNLTKSVNPRIFDGTNGASLTFNGNTDQVITGNFTGNNFRIPYITVNNPQGITLNGNVEIRDSLALTLGNIRTSPSSLLILQNDGVDIVPEGGSEASFVDGPMNWTLSSGSSERIFPLGKDDPTDVDDRYRPLVITQRSAVRTWTAEYFNGLAFDDLAQVTSMTPEDPVVIKTVSLQEYWIVNSNTGTSTTARIGLSWGDSSAVNPNPSDYQKLVVLAYDEVTDVWDSYGALSSSFSSATGEFGTFESEDPIPFTQRIITLGSRDEINPLPVTWLYFEGETDGKNHTLSWATASEQANDKFILERSNDAREWAKIAEIDGAGQSNSTLEYQYVDRVAPMGRVYYRLSQVDYDGAFEYAPRIVSLERALPSSPGKLEFVIFPNPNSQGTARILASDLAGSNALLMISDMSGKTLSKQIISLNGQGISGEIDCNFNPGIYLFSILTNERTHSERLVITK
jgi:hypothetical protein